MKGKVLIFEKNIEWYLDLCEKIKESGFEVNEGLNKFEKQKMAMKNFFNKYIIDEIRDCSKTKLSGIICNYHLSNNLNGAGVVKYVRNYFPDESRLKELCDNLPIIGYSTKSNDSFFDKINNWGIERSFISSGANIYMNKNELENIGRVLKYFDSKSNLVSF